MEGGGNVKREGEGHREIERVSKEKRDERQEGGLGIWYKTEKDGKVGEDQGVFRLEARGKERQKMGWK